MGNNGSKNLNKGRAIPGTLCRSALFAALVSLCSCDASSSREIGGGYRLKRTGNPPQFALITPHENGGLIIDEIGWRPPVIVARGSGSTYWDAIDTAHARHVRISDAQRKTEAVYQAVPIQGVEAAWNGLQGHSRLW